MTLQQELNYLRRVMQGAFMSVARDKLRGQRNPPHARTEKANILELSHLRRGG